jgi:small GTP-binding protein
MHDYTVKTILVGNSGVGKSSLLTKLVGARPVPKDHVATIGVEYESHTVLTASPEGAPARVKFQVWDTAGQERFAAITRSYYRRTSLIVMVYSVTDPRSASDCLHRWWADVCAHIQPSGVAVVIVGNKRDRLAMVDSAALAEMDAHVRELKRVVERDTGRPATHMRVSAANDRDVKVCAVAAPLCLDLPDVVNSRVARTITPTAGDNFALTGPSGGPGAGMGRAFRNLRCRLC